VQARTFHHELSWPASRLSAAYGLVEVVSAFRVAAGGNVNVFDRIIITNGGCLYITSSGLCRTCTCIVTCVASA
jgi:hypothetical protein